VVEDFSQTHKAEAHAEAQESTRAGDVGNPAHLFRLSKPLAVRLLDKYVDDCKVALGVVVDLGFNGKGQGFVVQPLPAPPIVFAVIDKIWKELKSRAKVWKVCSQWNSLQVVKNCNLKQMCFKLLTFGKLQVFESSFFPRMQNSSLSCV